MKKVFRFMTGKTAQGVQFHTAKMVGANTVSVGVLIHAGTRDEIWPQQAGLAHAIEHMDFQGTEKFPTKRDLSALVEDIGGVINAFTAKEMIFHWACVPTRHVRCAFENLSQRLRKVLIPQEKIGSEMNNVIQEIRMNQDNPMRQSYRIASEFIYGSHPLGRDTLGLEESVSSFTRDDFISFRKLHYKPSNFEFIVTGNLSHKEAKLLWEEYFPEDATQVRNSYQAVSAKLPFEQERIVTRDIKQAHMVLTALIPGNKKNLRISRVLSFFSDCIGNGASSPLYQEIRTKRGLCYTVNASTQRWSDVGLFSVYVGTGIEKIDEARKAVHEVIEKTCCDKTRFNATKEMLLGSVAMETESTHAVLRNSAFDIICNNGPQGYGDIVKELASITFDEIKQVVNEHIRPEFFRRLIVCPK